MLRSDSIRSAFLTPNKNMLIIVANGLLILTPQGALPHARTQARTHAYFESFALHNIASLTVVVFFHELLTLCFSSIFVASGRECPYSMPYT